MHDFIIILAVMSFGSIIHQLSDENKKTIRNIENLNKKMINADLSVLVV